MIHWDLALARSWVWYKLAEYGRLWQIGWCKQELFPLRGLWINSWQKNVWDCWKGIQQSYCGLIWLVACAGICYNHRQRSAWGDVMTWMSETVWEQCVQGSTITWEAELCARAWCSHVTVLPSRSGDRGWSVVCKRIISTVLLIPHSVE